MYIIKVEHSLKIFMDAPPILIDKPSDINNPNDVLICDENIIKTIIEGIYKKIPNLETYTKYQFYEDIEIALSKYPPNKYFTVACKLDNNIPPIQWMIDNWAGIIDNLIHSNLSKESLDDIYPNLSSDPKNITKYCSNLSTFIASRVNAIYNSYIKVLSLDDSIFNESYAKKFNTKVKIFTGSSKMNQIVLERKLEAIVNTKNKNITDLKNLANKNLYTIEELYSLPWAAQSNLMLEDHISQLFQEVNSIVDFNKMTPQQKARFTELLSIIRNYNTLATTDYLQVPTVDPSYDALLLESSDLYTEVEQEPKQDLNELDYDVVWNNRLTKDPFDFLANRYLDNLDISLQKELIDQYVISEPFLLDNISYDKLSPEVFLKTHLSSLPSEIQQNIIPSRINSRINLFKPNLIFSIIDKLKTYKYLFISALFIISVIIIVLLYSPMSMSQTTTI
ncbi:hypothetical protein NEOKW01_0049 [Nematocida sp. AWRm80]|nr:hypothetical protein NEOKW01_0049 [Nematocida sp. AWRm80]